MVTKANGNAATDELFHKLSAPHYGEPAVERRSRVEFALLQMCAQLERELMEAKGEKR